MAYVNSTRTGSVALGDRFGTVLQALRLAIHRRGVFARTRNELNALSDRDLADLGITRAMIDAVAHEAAYGK